MTCDCITEIEKKLEERNTRLRVTFSIPRAPGDHMQAFPLIGTEKIESRKRVGPMMVVPTFCPFCGKSYRPLPAEPTA